MSKEKNLFELSENELDKMYEEYRDSLSGGPNRPRGISDAEYKELYKSKKNFNKGGAVVKKKKTKMMAKGGMAKKKTKMMAKGGKVKKTKMMAKGGKVKGTKMYSKGGKVSKGR